MKNKWHELIRNKEKIKSKKVKLNLGCRDDLQEGFIGLDISPKCSADIIWDLNKTPWPFDNSSVDEIFTSHCIEHLDCLDTFLKEVYRICKPSAKITLIYPHYSRGDFSTQHKHMYGIRILNDYPDMFNVKKITFRYVRMSWKIWYKLPLYLIIEVINFLANLSPKFCERVWCYWLGGFDICKVETRVTKNVK